MVALSPRFSVLAAFISLASISTSPLGVGAAVIPRAENNANTARFFGSTHLQSAFRLSQAKAVKRHDHSWYGCEDGDLVCLWLGGTKVLKRAQHARKLHEHPKRSRGILGRAEAKPENGQISIINSDGKPLGFLEIVKNDQDSHPNSYTVKESPDNPTTFSLVRESSASQSDASHDGGGLQVVSVQVPDPERSGTDGMRCMGYKTSQNGAFSVSSCQPPNSEMSQKFGYNETSHDILPLTYAPQGNDAQGVLSRADGGQDKDGKGPLVTLRFIPALQSVNAEDVDEGFPTATATKTVTVTNLSTSTASLSAADTGATPSANASSSASVGSTSTANGAAPTAGTGGAAGVLDVEVVQASSAPSTNSSANASSASAAPTTTMNPQDIAASIANSSAVAASPTAAASPSSSGTGSLTSQFSGKFSPSPAGVIMESSFAERVLSIQSHVVYGYVGGKAAVFPLQCLGYDVDVVNTVHFSNHSGYGRSGGTKATTAELNAIFEGMERNELIMPTRLLTGYVPGAEGLSAVANLARKLKRERPNLIYLLDPVMGDAGKLYVAADVIPIYREMLPLATIISPNWFEVETLTDTKLEDLPSLREALSIIHEKYHVPNVVISSIPLTSWLASALPSVIGHETDTEQLLCIVSSSSPDSTQGKPIVYAQSVPLIPGYFSGVGDLFSALLLAHFPHPTTSNTDFSPKSTSMRPIAHAAAHALATTHHILRLTHAHAITLPEHERLPTDDEADSAEPLRKTRRMRGRELRLIQGQAAIRGVGLDVKPMVVWEGFWDI
ncbi:hypothetical protein C0995_001144 [Termitomyces sp. Mi166|nr:hypothetical protein C0995_001144 [Termitomyces sp. Mi166\